MTPRKPKAPRAPGTAGIASATGTAGTTSGEVFLLDRPLSDRLSGNVLDFPTPRRSHRLRNILLSVLVLVLVLGGVVAYAVFSPALALRTVEVEGNSLVPTAEVEAALAPLMGTSLTRISPEQVRDLLTGKPPVEDVEISAEPPSTLVVTLRERVPVAVLQSGGEFVLIDAEGRQLTSVERRDEVRLPLIDGGTNAVTSDVFPSITAVLAELPVSVLSRLNSASAASVDSIQLSLTGDQKIFWGSAERSAQKAQVLEALLAMPATEPPVREFDVSTPDRPVTR